MTKATRTYEPKAFKIGDGHSHMRQYVMHCSAPGCNAATEVKINNTHSSCGMAPEFLNKKFRQRGWAPGRDAHHDLCPVHAYRRNVSVVEERGNVVPINNQTPPPLTVVEPPRTMERADRRLIIDKLTEVYLDERSGYAPPWTDAAVAKDLGCPLAWVAELRDENFGPIPVNAEVTEAVMDARKLLDEARDLLERVAKITTDVTALAGTAVSLKSKVEMTEQKLNRIEKALKP